VVPLRIGLITSRDSAAYHDFISELKQSGFSFIVHCFDAHMQGVNVEKDLIRALDYFNSLKKSLDLIVISRGGGSTADLSWFDNQRIAEKTAAADIPVISAIGHEINCTITDLVAHTYFKTPTKAAQFLVEKVTEFLEALLDRQGRIVEGTLQSLDRGKQQLQTSLLKMQVNLQQASRKAREGLLGLKFRITNQAVSFLSEQQGLLSALQDRVGILDPQHVLKRGFSITYHGGKVLKDAALAAEGAVIQTVLLKGTISSKIVKEKE
jgi:exodeoxyribonuclease VII large subunit